MTAASACLSASSASWKGVPVALGWLAILHSHNNGCSLGLPFPIIMSGYAHLSRTEPDLSHLWESRLISIPGWARPQSSRIVQASITGDDLITLQHSPRSWLIRWLELTWRKQKQTILIILVVWPCVVPQLSTPNRSSPPLRDRVSCGPGMKRW